MKVYFKIIILIIIVSAASISCFGCSSSIKNENETTKSTEVTATQTNNTSDKLFSKDIIIVLNNIKFNLNKQFDDNQLKAIDSKGLAILRNSIYAKYGYVFSTKEFKDYFSQFDWYKPLNKNVEKELTEIDKQNINKILFLEKTQITNSSLGNELKGTWINKTYLNSIKVKRSLIEAYSNIKSPQILCFSIFKEDNGLRFIGTHDYHQGYPDGTIKNIYKDKNNLICIDLGGEINKGVMSFKIVDNQTLSLVKNGESIDFLRISTSESYGDLGNEFIRKLLFSGYVSEDGSKYFFDENGHAIFNGQKIDYTVNMDWQFARCDYIKNTSSKDNKIYAFKFKGDKLYIYNAGLDKTGSIIDISNTTPIAILTKK